MQEIGRPLGVEFRICGMEIINAPQMPQCSMVRITTSFIWYRDDDRGR
jgi:hypothetical protein